VVRTFVSRFWSLLRSNWQKKKSPKHLTFGLTTTTKLVLDKILALVGGVPGMSPWVP
jgi:hypothetical protein